jgi:hypothetical protein
VGAKFLPVSAHALELSQRRFQTSSGVAFPEIKADESREYSCELSQKARPGRPRLGRARWFPSAEEPRGVWNHREPSRSSFFVLLALLRGSALLRNQVVRERECSRSTSVDPHEPRSSAWHFLVLDARLAGRSGEGLAWQRLSCSSVAVVNRRHRRAPEAAVETLARPEWAGARVARAPLAQAPAVRARAELRAPPGEAVALGRVVAAQAARPAAVQVE